MGHDADAFPLHQLSHSAYSRSHLHWLLGPGVPNMVPNFRWMCGSGRFSREAEETRGENQAHAHGSPCTRREQHAHVDELTRRVKTTVIVASRISKIDLINRIAASVAELGSKADGRSF